MRECVVCGVGECVVCGVGECVVCGVGECVVCGVGECVCVCIDGMRGVRSQWSRREIKRLKQRKEQ